MECIMCKSNVPYRTRDMICYDCRPNIKESRPTAAEMEEIVGYLPKLSKDHKELDSLLEFIRRPKALEPEQP
jgi:hypothetical protein